MKDRLPALFIGHGSPMNAIETNEYTKMLNKLGETIGKPKAVLVISAHWLTEGSYIDIQNNPKQIYDFYGFPRELYEVDYKPSGSSEYAIRAYERLKAFGVKSTKEWGLDHGSWAILKHLYPNADIPAFQLSLNHAFTPEEHYNLGKKLKELRDEGYLILGSGNIVHNLRKMDFDASDSPFDWAKKFDDYIANSLISNNHLNLINYKSQGITEKLALPTDEHYLPLLYIAALQEADESISFLHEGIEFGSLSMRSFVVS
ncbi:4,5-DOPA dioxygenase extradiol [Clostridium sp. C8-1-8]|uniref:4,5-DOPA-extradiol-dioxygenase n=1 Tax=Clostridium sp. C8-1-8 TaxID=2698831 RepID=UPI001368ECA2|nr:4,5-DOPA dioxygenase extradiol [Clostridium sp. C8-1-8]